MQLSPNQSESFNAHYNLKSYPLICIAKSCYAVYTSLYLRYML